MLHNLRFYLIVLIVIISVFGLLINVMDVFTDNNILPVITAANINHQESFDTPSLKPINVTTYDFSKLFIYGDKQYCNKYTTDRRTISYKYKFKSAMIGGLYNTGTNALLHLLKSNCYGLNHTRHTDKELTQNISRNVKYFQRFNFKSLYNITKHEAIPSMEQLIEKNIPYDSDYSTEELYIIIIKDPYTWIKSMCKASYYVVFGRYYWTKHPLCPQNISQYNGTMSANQWHGHLFNNIIELYNIYYQSWLGGNLTVGIGTLSRNKALSQIGGFKTLPIKRFYKGLQKFVFTFVHNGKFRNKTMKHELFHYLQTFYKPVKLPHIVIRFEDILFRPEDVVDKVCQCVGGFRTEDTWLQENAAKRHGKSKTRQQALAAYADQTYRYINYNENDIKFVNSVLNISIMKMFGYNIG
eukprot:297828_1